MEEGWQKSETIESTFSGLKCSRTAVLAISVDGEAENKKTMGHFENEVLSQEIALV